MLNPVTIDEAMNNLNIHHLITEAKKYNRPNQTINNSQICGESIIEEINKNNITLKAFTFDHFGSLGPQAEKYFYDIKKDNKINDPKALKKFSKQGLKAYNRNNENKQCSNLFRKANEGWKLVQIDNWFGTTYQTTAPSTWGSLYLHTNINHAFINHIIKSMEKTERLNTNKPKKKKYKIIGKQCLETEKTIWKYGTYERNHEVKVNNIEDPRDPNITP